MTNVPDIDAKDVAKGLEKAYGSWFQGYIRIFLLRAIEWSMIYLCGYYDISFGWLLAPIFFLVLRDKRAKEKQVKFDIVRHIANSDEREFLQEIQKFSNLPSWVTFPDMERVEWLNKITRQLWPYAGQFCKDLCNETIEPAIQAALKEYKLSGFKFEKIILGDTPARISGIKVYDNTSRHEIIMDADFIYAGDCKFEFSIAKLKAGMKDLQISGRIRVVMKPLVRQIPLVGGLQVFFLNNPDVDFNLIGFADVLDMPGVSDILRNIVTDQIANMMVLPNRFPIQLIENIDIVELKAPLPAGVLRIQVLEAKNLVKKDFAVLGMGKSDPYCVLQLGAQKFKTKTINNSVNPVWNYCCEFIVDETSGQEVDFELFDLDDGPYKDENLGRSTLDVQYIYDNGEVDMWVPLSDTKSGRIHIKATWLELSDNSNDLTKQLEEVLVVQDLTRNPLHAALLAVWVDSASKLNNIPDPFVRLHVANTKHETVAHIRTNDPVFEEGFTFLVRDPQTQELQVEIIDQRTNQSQGRVDIVLNTLLAQKDMEMKGETFTLTKSTGGGLASIKMTITLKVFKSSLSKNIPDSSLETEYSIDSPSESTLSQEVSVLPIDTDTKSAKSEPVKEVKSDIAEVEPEISEMAPLFKSTPESEDSSGTVRQRHISGGGFGLGRIKLTMKYGPKNSLFVIVHEVSNLPKEEDGEIPDPYVKIYLLPGRSKESKRKTDVVKDSCNPTYNEQFEYTVQPAEITQKSIQVSVINKKGFFHMQKSAVMGQVHVECDSLSENQKTEWYDLKPATDEDED